MRFCRVVVLGLLVAALISGCGRRGGLEPPPNAQTTTTAAPGDPPSETDSPPQRKNVPERPFILDGLI